MTKIKFVLAVTFLIAWLLTWAMTGCIQGPGMRGYGPVARYSFTPPDWNAYQDGFYDRDTEVHWVPPVPGTTPLFNNCPQPYSSQSTYPTFNSYSAPSVGNFGRLP